MNPVFIGSSAEAKPFADAVARVVAESDLFYPVRWWDDGVFKEGQSFLDSLFELVTEIDYAILIASPSDQTFKRSVPSLRPRDNVVFEYGLFAGRNGRSKVALMKIGNTETMSDLEGISLYEVEATEQQLQNPEAEGEDRLHALVAPVVNRCLDAFLIAIAREEALLTDICWRAARFGFERKIRLLADISYLRRQETRPLSPPLEHVSRIIQSSCKEGMRKVGREDLMTDVPYYVELSQLSDCDLDDLALAVACRLVTEFEYLKLKPSRIGLHSRRGTENRRGTEVMQRVAQHLDLPLVFVDIDVSEKGSVKGTLFEGEEIIFLHDFTVSGNTPVQCITRLRRRHVQVRYLFSFIVHEARTGELNTSMQKGDLYFRPLACLKYDSDRPEVTWQEC